MKTTDSIKIRNGEPSDHEKVVSVMPSWWDGRDLTNSMLKVFFIHFCNTTYIAQMSDELVGFLVGFLSQSDENAGYIHFVGVIQITERLVLDDFFIRGFLMHVK